MTDRISQELALLRSHYQEVEYFEEGQWVMIRNYLVPSELQWNKEKVDVCFQIPTGYPGCPPYGFYVPSNLLFEDSPPKNNYNLNPPVRPPFEHTWGFFSWINDSTWRATADLVSCSNLTNFVRTFADRLKQGA